MQTGSSSSASSGLAGSTADGSPHSTVTLDQPQASALPQLTSGSASKEPCSVAQSRDERPSSPQLPKAPKSALVRQHSQSVPTSPTSPSKVTFQHVSRCGSHSRDSPFARAAAKEPAGKTGQGPRDSPGDSAETDAQSPAQVLKAEPGANDTMPGSEQSTNAPRTDRHTAVSPPPNIASGSGRDSDSQHQSNSTHLKLPTSSVTIPNRSSATVMECQSGFQNSSSSIAGTSPEGMSPPDGYLGDSEQFVGGRSPSPSCHMGPVPGFEMSLCGPHLSPSTR